MIDQVVAVIGVMLFGLDAATGVGGTRQEGGLARMCGCQPIELPKLPGVLHRLADDSRALLGGTQIVTELDLGNLAVTRPSRTMDAVFCTRWHNLGDRRTRNLRFDQQLLNGQ